MLFFSYQAADGIRSYKVTGVQTCALPIWDRAAGRAGDRLRSVADARSGHQRGRFGEAVRAHDDVEGQLRLHGVDEIGRASCREREERRDESQVYMEVIKWQSYWSRMKGHV